MNYLCTFADKRLARSLDRITKQAKELNFFEKIYAYNEDDLTNEFREKFKDKLNANIKGFGYWCWKPEIIIQTLEKINDGDCLLYVDVGCHLNKNGMNILLEYFEVVAKSPTGLVAFQANPPSKINSKLVWDGRKLFDQPNYQWIKGDLLDHFGVRENEQITHSQAIGAGIILIKKNKQSIAILNEWLNIYYDNFSLANDSPSKSPNLEGFIEHRHDQAILTLLCLKHGVPTLSAYEFWYPKKNTKKLQPDWNALKDFPIQARRDKDMGIIANTMNKLNLKIKKILSLI